MKPTSDASTPASGRPTLEDLLRVKRAERPDADFWTDFERGLRQKQLAAMIEPRPWWLAPMLFARRHRAALALVPVAAAAAVAFVGIQGSTTALAPSGTPASAPVLASLPTESAPPSAALPDERPQVASTTVSPAPDVALASSASVPASIATLAESAVASEPAPVVAIATDTQAPAAEIAPAFEPARPFMPEVLADLDRVFAALAVAAAGTAEVAGLFDASGEASDELSELESVAFEGLDERHARLLASAGSERFIQASSVDHAGTRERMVHSLAGGEELYASVSRLGMRGDRLSLKF